jgi:hypothetical protein
MKDKDVFEIITVTKRNQNAENAHRSRLITDTVYQMKI